MLVVARKPRFQRENSGFRATTCFGGGCRASNDARLEREEVADLHVEGVGDTAEVVETHAHAPDSMRQMCDLLLPIMRASFC